MLILYVILVLCTIAVVGVALACWRLVRRHTHGSLRGGTPLQPSAPTLAGAGQNGEQDQR